MKKLGKILIAVILIAAAGFFLYRELTKKPPIDELESYRQSIVADPKVGSGLDLTEEQKNNYLQQFKKAKEEVLKANLDTLQGLNEIAQLKRILGDIEGAITAWEYANIIRPQNSLSFANLAALYHYDLKQYDKAEKNYLISISNDPDDMPTIRNFFEFYFYSLKDNAKAEALLLESIEPNKENPDIYALTGSFYADTGNVQKAIEFYKKSLELNPGNQAVRQEIQRLEKL